MKDGYLIFIAKDAKTVVQVDGAYASNYSMADLEEISQYWIEKNQPNHSKKLRSYICKIIRTYRNPRVHIPIRNKMEDFLDLDLAALNDLDIRALNLSTRPYNALRGGDLESVGDVVNLTDHELSRFPGLGPKSLNEVKAKVKLLINKLDKAS